MSNIIFIAVIIVAGIFILKRRREAIRKFYDDANGFLSNGQVIYPGEFREYTRNISNRRLII